MVLNQADPLGSPKAPPVTTVGAQLNHNTIDDNPATPTNERLIPSNQSDNYPQNVLPRYRRVFTGPAIRRRVFPHPVLCGPSGAIKVLPDHMHEGRCDSYMDFGRTLDFGGYSFVEFPNSTGVTTQELPEVIADNINQIHNARFEAISVYDGHNTDSVGRVLCDATWHHFFNINLIEFEASRARVRAGTGNMDDIRAQRDYQNIRAYFRNIAYWLSRRADQNCMRRKGYHLVIHDFNFKIAWKPLEFVTDRLHYFHYWGELAKDSLNFFAPQCQWYEWILWPIKEHPIWRALVPLPPDFPGPIPNGLKWVDPEVISTMVLGIAVYDLFTFAEQQKEFTEETYEQFDQVALSSREETVKEILSEFNIELKILQKAIQLSKQ